MNRLHCTLSRKVHTSGSLSLRQISADFDSFFDRHIAGKVSNQRWFTFSLIQLLILHYLGKRKPGNDCTFSLKRCVSFCSQTHKTHSKLSLGHLHLQNSDCNYHTKSKKHSALLSITTHSLFTKSVIVSVNVSIEVSIEVIHKRRPQNSGIFSPLPMSTQHAL